MAKQRIHNRVELKLFRKDLRNNSTSAEATLWNHLKNRKLEGRKFGRQHSIGKYIVDFYCPEEKLAIELNGEGHFWEAGIQSDNNKSNYLYQPGIKVIRFENKWIFEDFDYVLNEIKTYLTANMVG